jgi:polyphenol oxidase
MIDILSSNLLNDAGFTHGFATRSGGASRGSYASLNAAFDVGDDAAVVRENTRRIAEAAGLDGALLRVRQVHGNRVVTATELIDEKPQDRYSPPTVEADAIVAPADTEAALAVQTADCAAVLLADPRTGVVAAVHAGWRGTAAGVLRRTVRKMAELGASSGDLLAAVGPRICLQCYEVGEEVVRAFPESADPVRGKPGTFLLDLGRAVEVSLIGLGLRGDSIDLLEHCTACSTDMFFSHRAEGEPTGRQLSFIAARR